MDSPRIIYDVAFCFNDVAFDVKGCVLNLFFERGCPIRLTLCPLFPATFGRVFTGIWTSSDDCTRPLFND